MSFGARPVGYSAPLGPSQPAAWTNRSSPSFGMYAAASNGTNFVVGGAASFPQGSIYYSTDNGATWTLVTLSSMGGPILSAIWANSQYVVGAAGTTATSSDGITWTVSTQLSSTSYSTSTVNALVYLGSAVGYLAVGTNAAAASGTDGLNWNFKSGLNTAWGSTGITANCAATNGSIYCVGGNSGRIATTSDTTTWTDRNSLRGGPWSTSPVRGMAYGAGKFVVVGGASGGFPQTAYSSDGITWTYNGTLPLASGANPFVPAYCVTWTGSFFIAGSEDGNIATSPDGITWTSYPALYNLSAWGSREVLALTNNSSTIVAAGWSSGGVSGRIATSP